MLLQMFVELLCKAENETSQLEEMPENRVITHKTLVSIVLLNGAVGRSRKKVRKQRIHSSLHPDFP